MARISLIDQKLDKQINGRNIILFDVYFEKLFNFNILIMLKYSGSLRYAVYTFNMIDVDMFKEIFKDINMPEGMYI